MLTLYFTIGEKVNEIIIQDFKYRIKTKIQNKERNDTIVYKKMYEDAELFRLSDKETTQYIKDRTCRFIISLIPVTLL